MYVAFVVTTGNSIFGLNVIRFIGFDDHQVLAIMLPLVVSAPAALFAIKDLRLATAVLGLLSFFETVFQVQLVLNECKRHGCETLGLPSAVGTSFGAFYIVFSWLGFGLLMAAFLLQRRQSQSQPEGI
jgi:formate hydrogenlyase subunit 3/multisubunit Na+/H+ antiporter MnhD subunit